MTTRYGAENTFLVPELRAKVRATMMARYGHEYAAQVPEMFDRIVAAGFKHTPISLDDGRIVQMQGYEPQALEWMLANYVDPCTQRLVESKDMLFNKADVPEIFYDSDDDKTHRYYCDFYLPTQRLVVEVKSPYTLIAGWKTNLLKFEAVIHAGFNLLIIVMNDKELVAHHFCEDLYDLEECIKVLQIL